MEFFYIGTENPNMRGSVNMSILICEMKLHIHSQTSIVSDLVTARPMMIQDYIHKRSKWQTLNSQKAPQGSPTGELVGICCEENWLSRQHFNTFSKQLTEWPRAPINALTIKCGGVLASTIINAGSTIKARVGGTRVVKIWKYTLLH